MRTAKAAEALALAVFLLALGGCETTTDPREGGLIGGIHGMSSGAYEERLRQREQSLERLRAIQERLEEERTDLESAKQSKAAEVQAQRRQLNALLEETQHLSADVARVDATLAKQEASKTEISNRLIELQANIRRLGEDADQGTRLEELEERRAALEQEYRLLLDLYLELSQ